MIDASSVHVWLEVRGGLAGRRLEADLAGDDLSEPDLAALTSVLGGPRAAGGPVTAPDATRYDLRVRLEGALHAVSFTDLDLPPELRPLVQRMVASRRPSG